MYTSVLVLHSWLRWVALVAGMGVTLAAVRDRGTSEGLARMDRWGLALVTALDLQMLVGLLLYLVLSPVMMAIRENLGEAMRNPVSRFWAVEHISTMVVAVVLVHVGRVLGRKGKTPEAKRMRMLVCFGIATLAMIAATPWPGMTNARPLFRF
jgi:hypothetical protein